MSSTITFSDGKSFEMISAYGRNQLTNSLADLLAKTDREILEIHFDSTIVNMGELQEYYMNPDEKTGILTITDESGESFVHKDYVIPMKFGMEYVGSDPNPHIIMVFAQLTETDKALREVSGKRKVYTGTDLEIAIAKKLDELSSECKKNIISGFDIGDDHYSLNIEDEVNIASQRERAKKGQYVQYHADGKPCRIYSPEEFLEIANKAEAHITHHTTYCNLLMRWIESMTNCKEVNTVKYGIDLPNEYANQYNEIISVLVSNSLGQ